nr:hypothetical protein Iba_chr04cCG4230 [Ipomoea batatas]
MDIGEEQQWPLPSPMESVFKLKNPPLSGQYRFRQKYSVSLPSSGSFLGHGFGIEVEAILGQTELPLVGIVSQDGLECPHHHPSMDNLCPVRRLNHVLHETNGGVPALSRMVDQHDGAREYRNSIDGHSTVKNIVAGIHFSLSTFFELSVEKYSPHILATSLVVVTAHRREFASSPCSTTVLSDAAVEGTVSFPLSSSLLSTLADFLPLLLLVSGLPLLDAAAASDTLTLGFLCLFLQTIVNFVD